MNSQQNASKALKKFNNMYEHVTSKHSTEKEYHIVANYGTFMLTSFPDFFKNNKEIEGKVRAVRQAEIRQQNEDIVKWK